MAHSTLHQTLANIGHLKRELKERWTGMSLEEQLTVYFAVGRLLNAVQKKQLKTTTPRTTKE